MTQKHTPGPWTPAFTQFDDRTLVAEIEVNTSPFRGDVTRLQSCEHIGGINQDEMRANAYLISAAPDMLRLCKLVNDSFGGGRIITFSDDDLREFAEVIAKATGGAA